MDRAKLAQVAENAYVGAPTGLLDQAASTLCEAEAGLFLDCRSLETQQVPLPLAEQGLEILVLDTKTPHSHVDGEYGARRASCEEASAILGVRALREIERVLVPHYGAGCPVVVAYRVGWPDQMLIRGTLSDIREKVRAEKITRTALILVGPAMGEVRDFTDSALYDAAQPHVLRPRVRSAAR